MPTSRCPSFAALRPFARGGPVEEMPRITQRICGVCPTAHHMAAVKAADAVFKVDPPPTAKKIRELVNSAFSAATMPPTSTSLAAPILSSVRMPTRPQRNILGVVAKVGLTIGKRVIQQLQEAHEVVALLGGRFVHPVLGLPGGVAKAGHRRDATAADRDRRAFRRVRHLFAAALASRRCWAATQFREMISSPAYLHRTHNMGLVDDNNRVNFYDGHVRVVDVEGTGDRPLPPGRVPRVHQPSAWNPGPT